MSTDAHVSQQTSSAAAKVPHRWRNLATLTGVTVVDNTESGLVSTLFPAISSALGLNSGHLGLLSALGKFVAVPFGPAWVWLTGRIGRRGGLIVTTILGGVFGVLAGFAANFGLLLLFNTLMSACVIGATPIANAVIADSFDDRSRAKAAGYLYGAVNSIAAFLGPVLALFTGLTDGWRYGMWTIGAICVVSGLVVALFFTDPGVGAAESELADLSTKDRIKTKVTAQSVLSLFRIPTFALMMLSRLLSGHLLITIFGIQFLVKERGFTNPIAALVLIPFGLGYLVGTVGGGWLVRLLDEVLPARGRVYYLQIAQVLFAAAAFFGTQFHYGSIGTYCVFWALMGLGQGVNPPVNRPIVAAVVLPELRGQAFAIWLTIFETVGWALFSLGAGQLADVLGIQTVFLWIMVILMLLNAAVLSGLYACYPRDVRRVTTELGRRRAEALARS
ncbi:MFS transporter [Amycolatopsis sp. NPDC051903]|uniref:MFS transporter n=1 Tax=Amycolatopsis sp. NPDC051903 TaxID=3363936 RepID=UPI00379A2E15